MNLVASSTVCTLYERKQFRPFSNWANAFAISHSLLGTKQHLVGGSMAWVPITPNTWGLRCRTMSLGPNGLARFPLPASQGSGHGGWILTFPQALGWDGGGGWKQRKDSEYLCLVSQDQEKIFPECFWSCFTLFCSTGKWERGWIQGLTDAGQALHRTARFLVHFPFKKVLR